MTCIYNNTIYLLTSSYGKLMYKFFSRIIPQLFPLLNSNTKLSVSAQLIFVRHIVTTRSRGRKAGSCTRMFVNLFTTAHHCTLSFARLIQTTASHPKRVSQQNEGRILYVHLAAMFYVTVVVPLT